MGDSKYYGDLFCDNDEKAFVVKFKYRNKRLIKIWAMIMGVEIVLLAAFIYVVDQMFSKWC